jgi:hypothetical protein
MDLIGSVIAANPCPPMPMQCNRMDPATGKPGVGFLNTHHVLMQAYAHAMQRDNQKENAERQNMQKILTGTFIASFTDGNGPPDPVKLYNAAGTFTRSYLHSFMPMRPIPDARFAPYEEVHKSTYGNNPIVRASCEHLAGMIFYDECPVGDDILHDEHGVAIQQRPYDEILESLKREPFSSVLCKYADVHRARMTDVATLVEIGDE